MCTKGSTLLVQDLHPRPQSRRGFATMKEPAKTTLPLIASKKCASNDNNSLDLSLTDNNNHACDHQFFHNKC